MRTRALLHCSVSPPTHHIRSSTPHRRAKERTYPEIMGGGRARLVVVALETGGRWSQEAATLLRLMARNKTQSLPASCPPRLDFKVGGPHVCSSHALLRMQPPPFASLHNQQHRWTRAFPRRHPHPSPPTATLPPACSPPTPALNAMWILHIWRLASIKAVSPASTSGDWPV